MSKESKPRDRHRQSIEAVRDRPSDFCPGCGYFNVVQGYHRPDCTAHPTGQR
jgi:hypothetical protein